jgi:hypothetical protein
MSIDKNIFSEAGDYINKELYFPASMFWGDGPLGDSSKDISFLSHPKFKKNIYNNDYDSLYKSFIDETMRVKSSIKNEIKEIYKASHKNIITPNEYKFLEEKIKSYHETINILKDDEIELQISNYKKDIENFEKKLSEKKQNSKDYKRFEYKLGMVKIQLKNLESQNDKEDISSKYIVKMTSVSKKNGIDTKITDIKNTEAKNTNTEETITFESKRRLDIFLQSFIYEIIDYIKNTQYTNITDDKLNDILINKDININWQKLLPIFRKNKDLSIL